MCVSDQQKVLKLGLPKPDGIWEIKGGLYTHKKANPGFNGKCSYCLLSTSMIYLISLHIARFKIDWNIIIFKIVNFFSENFLDKTPWITITEDTNKLFCWPCLLFNSVRGACWAERGYEDMKHLDTAIKTHEGSGPKGTTVKLLILIYNKVSFYQPPGCLEKHKMAR